MKQVGAGQTVQQNIGKVGPMLSCKMHGALTEQFVRLLVSVQATKVNQNTHLLFTPLPSSRDVELTPYFKHLQSI